MCGAGVIVVQAMPCCMQAVWDRGPGALPAPVVWQVVTLPPLLCLSWCLASRWVHALAASGMQLVCGHACLPAPPLLGAARTA